MTVDALDRPRLVFMDEKGRKHVAPIGANGLTLGRARENNLHFSKFDGVSRYHSEIMVTGSQCLLLDRGSSGGTFVNDLPIQEHVLQDGDIIQLGPRPAPILAFRAAEEGHADEHDAPVEEAPDEPLTVLAPADALFLDPSRFASAPKSSQERIRALYEATSSFLACLDVDALCKQLLEQVFKLMDADRGSVLLRNAETDELIKRATQVGSLVDASAFRPSRTVTGRVASDNVAVLSLDAATDSRFAHGQSMMVQSVRSVVCAPISSHSRLFGVIYLDTVMARRSFTDDDLQFLLALSRQAATVLENLRLLEDQKRTFESMMRALAQSIDARDGITAGHSSRVAKYSQAIARHMGMDAAQARRIWYAGLLHDYGKIGTREAVLCKPGALTPEEYEHIKEHPRHTYKILSSINFSDDMADLPLVASSHHERPDGKGYPSGLRGDEIPVGGRIIAVADFFDALTVKRHYREPMPLDEVIVLMEKGRDTQFDGVVLSAFRTWFDKEYLPFSKRLAERKAAREFATDQPTETLKTSR